MISMFLISPTGAVHAERGGRTCPPATHTRARVPVSPNQALVYKLENCDACWTNVSEYNMHVRGSRS